MLEIIARIVDDSSFYEYKKNYGKTLVCGNASIGGIKVGIIANQKIHIKTNNSGIQLVNDESLRDTLIDLHNYSAMAILLIDKK